MIVEVEVCGRHRQHLGPTRHARKRHDRFDRLQRLKANGPSGVLMHAGGSRHRGDVRAL